MKAIINLITNLLFVWMAFFPVFAHAQHLDAPDTVSRTQTGSSPQMAFPSVVGTVLQDFPDNFRHITGALVLAQGEIENYASTIELPGAVSCTITRYHSVEDTTASWQAKMYEGDHFSEASRLYGELYGKMKTCTLQLPDGGIVYLRGEWKPAKEEAPFTTSTLKLVTGDQRYKYLKIEVELVYLLGDWVININIASKRPDDEVGAGNG